MADNDEAEDEFAAVHQAIGERVRALRGERGLGAGRLAQRAGLHWTYVRELEQGKRRLSVATLMKLARGLDVDPCDLIRDLDVPARLLKNNS
jgi:transcriptional regulator with XRE-family HTH domain